MDQAYQTEDRARPLGSGHRNCEVEGRGTEAADCVGRLCARRFLVEEHGPHYYLGVVTEVTEAEDGRLDATGEEETHLVTVMYEDGADDTLPWSEVERGLDFAPSDARLCICPTGPHGRPLRATYVHRRAIKTGYGLLTALGRHRGQERARVTAAERSSELRVAEERRENPEAVPGGTTQGRATTESLAPGWRWAELPAGRWPLDLDGDPGTLPEQFEALWAWLKAGAAEAEGAEAGTGRADTQLPAPFADGARPAPPDARGGPARLAPVVPEADASDVPASERASFMKLLEDLSPAARHGFQAVNRERSLEGMRLELHKKRLSDHERGRPYRPRTRYSRGPSVAGGQLSSARDDQAIAEMVETMRAGKRSTFLKRRTVLEGYRQACSSRYPPTAMFPLTCANVGHWWTRTYLKGQSMTRLADDLSIVIRFARHAGYQPDAPRPGIDPLEDEDLSVVRKALQELDACGVRRAFPLTLRLFHFLMRHRPLNWEDLRDMQFWGRVLVAHGAMLRAEDHCKGRPRWGDWREHADRDGVFHGRATLLVRPGKMHSTFMPAEFGLPLGSAQAVESSMLDGARVMKRYRELLVRQLGQEPGAGDYLFVEIDAGGVANPSRYMSDKGFICELRERARACGLPAALTSQLRFHGFRAGGASDLFNYGHKEHAIVEFIMRQGRWNSTAFRIYLRLRADTVAAVVGEVYAQAKADDGDVRGCTPAELQRSNAMLLALRDDAYAGLHGQRKHRNTHDYLTNARRRRSRARRPLYSR